MDEIHRFVSHIIVAPEQLAQPQRLLNLSHSIVKRFPPRSFFGVFAFRLISSSVHLFGLADEFFELVVFGEFGLEALNFFRLCWIGNILDRPNCLGYQRRLWKLRPEIPSSVITDRADYAHILFPLSAFWG